MEERRLGPVVGLGTWSTFDRDAELAAEVVEGGRERCLGARGPSRQGGRREDLVAVGRGRTGAVPPPARLVRRPLGGDGEDRRRRRQLTEHEQEALGVETWAQALLSWALVERLAQ
jgi:hypothetical protein